MFVAIYTIRVPNAISSLMKYCEVVRDIAAKQGNWRYYDEQFRFLHQSKPDRYPWDNVAWELWHQAMHSSSPHAKIPTMIFELDGPTNVPFSPFPEGFVGDFIPVSSAGAAISNTPVSSLGQSIPQANAALPERTETQTMQPLAYPLGVTVRDEHRLLSRGPTPVRPDRLTFYLKGYNNVTSDYLIQGFLHGFSIRYFGSPLAIRSPNLKSAMDNPTSVNDKLSILHLIASIWMLNMRKFLKDHSLIYENFTLLGGVFEDMFETRNHA